MVLLMLLLLFPVCIVVGRRIVRVLLLPVCIVVHRRVVRVLLLPTCVVVSRRVVRVLLLPVCVTVVHRRLWRVIGVGGGVVLGRVVGVRGGVVLGAVVVRVGGGVVLGVLLDASLVPVAEVLLEGAEAVPRLLSVRVGVGVVVLLVLPLLVVLRLVFPMLRLPVVGVGVVVPRLRVVLPQRRLHLIHVLPLPGRVLGVQRADHCRQALVLVGVEQVLRRDEVGRQVLGALAERAAQPRNLLLLLALLQHGRATEGGTLC